MLHGNNFIGNERSSAGTLTFKAFNPGKNEELPELFYSATTTEFEKAVLKAKNAYNTYKNISGKEKAGFLRKIADNIEASGSSLIQRVMLETGLTEARLTGERNRTTNQLRLFAGLLEEGSWCEAAIDSALPDRKPAPRPDIRKVLRPIGPVVVFAASNFPLAFSTAGGDTASALAAGCPVIVKAHRYHPGTSEIVATAIIEAAAATGMPDGVFSMLHTIEHSVSQSFVTHPFIKAVGFTGSFTAGKLLYDIAQKRDEPIPVFAEMGSVNPVILLPGKVAQNAKELGEQLASSVTLGAGQFCTNPGIIITMSGAQTNEFKDALSTKIKSLVPETMLNPGIKKAYFDRTNETITEKGARLLAQSDMEEKSVEGRPIIAVVDADKFIANPKLAEEIFGPFSLIIECANPVEMSDVIRSLKGQLTATIMCTDKDVSDFRELIEMIQELAGRILFNGVPTGVEVCHAMQHGGPFPASTDSRFTSVGTGAIKRFVRPVAFQDAPDSYLPDELKNKNPLGIWRLMNGEFSKNEV